MNRAEYGRSRLDTSQRADGESGRSERCARRYRTNCFPYLPERGKIARLAASRILFRSRACAFVPERESQKAAILGGAFRLLMHSSMNAKIKKLPFLAAPFK